MKIKRYSELIRIQSFEERLEYLRLRDKVGFDKFGFDRIFNQKFYRSKEWKEIRNQIIIRDNGCDLGVEGHKIFGQVYIHHLNPLTLEDLQNNSDMLLNPENLITVSRLTHDAIHYGTDVTAAFASQTIIDRKPNDQIPWR